MSYKAVSISWIPLEGLRDNIIFGWCRYDGDTDRWNLRKIRQSTTLYSVIVRFLPTHILPPNPKGKNPMRCLQPPWTESAKRSGRNWNTSGPHNIGSWCMATTSIHMFVPLGMTLSPSPIRMSSRAWRCTFGAGEYRRRTSLRTQPICSRCMK